MSWGDAAPFLCFIFISLTGKRCPPCSGWDGPIQQVPTVSHSHWEGHGPGCWGCACKSTRYGGHAEWHGRVAGRALRRKQSEVLKQQHLKAKSPCPQGHIWDRTWSLKCHRTQQCRNAVGRHELYVMVSATFILLKITFLSADQLSENHN